MKINYDDPMKAYRNAIRRSKVLAYRCKKRPAFDIFGCDRQGYCAIVKFQNRNGYWIPKSERRIFKRFRDNVTYGRL